MSRSVLGLMMGFLVGFGALVGPVQGQFEPAARLVPDSANTLMLVQAKRIFDSQLSKQQNWRKDHSQAFKSGAAFLPVTTERVLIAAQLDLDTFQPLWKLSVFEKYGPEVSIGQLSEKIGGNIDDVAGKQAVVLPNDTYFVKIDDTMLAAYTPANRQATVRWLNSKRTPAITLSPYLGRALNYADQNASVILAVDLEGSVHADAIAPRLKLSGLIDEANIPAVADALSKIQGVMLGITVNDKITGSLRVDFSDNASVLKPYGHQLLLEILARRGAMIDDFKSWKVNETADTIVLSGPLSDTGFREVLSLVRHSINHDLIVSSSPGDEDQEPDTATVSKRYYDKLQTIVSDLQSAEKDKALNTYASWFERYASEIDEMSVINVDEDLVKFGTYLSDHFRDAAGVLRNAQFSKRSTQAGMSDSYYTERYGAWGMRSYSYYYDNSAARRAVGVQQNVAGESAARDILRDVAKQMGEVRRGLSERYKIDF